MANIFQRYPIFPAVASVAVVSAMYIGHDSGKKEAAPVHICRVDLNKDDNPDYVVEQHNGTKTGFLAEPSGTIRQLTEREQKDPSLVELISSCK